MTRNNEDGFSLVELIIVIAIMAILIGALTPIMIKYVEKARVSSDAQLLDSVYQAVAYAMADSDVTSDASSRALIDNMTTPCTLESLMIPSGNKLSKEIADTLGWSDLNQTTYEALLRSAHNSNCEIYLVYQGGIQNPLIMWITTTDQTGKKNTGNAPTTPAGIGNCINIQ